jgi:hypothetical protein
MLACLKHGEQYGADWVVVLQDDADPVEGWLDHLPPVLEQSPEPVLGLTYFGYQYSTPKKPETQYFRGQYVLQGGAFAVHRSLLDAGMTRWMEPLWEEDRFFDDDVVLAAFSRWVGSQTACVTHALFLQPVKSSLRNRPLKRPLAQRTIADGSSSYSRDRVENVDLGKVSLELTLLLQAVFDRQAKIVAPTVTREDVWM